MSTWTKGTPTEYLTHRGIIKHREPYSFTYEKLREFLEDYQCAQYIERIRKPKIFVDDPPDRIMDR